MWRCGSVPVLVLAVVPIFVLSGHSPKNQRLKPSFIFPRAIKNYGDFRGGDQKNFLPPQGGQREEGVGNPAEWTMSKANLVAEFYSTENAPPPGMLPPQRDRSQKSFFSFFTNNNNNSRSGPAPPPPASPQGNSRLTPYPPPRNGNINLIASETNYNPQAFAFDNSRHGQSGYSTPFRPIVKFPQQNYIIPPNLHESGYPNNLRPPRGPPPPPQGSWEGNSAQINGLRPPFNGPPPQQPQSPPNPPGKLYLPPPQQITTPNSQYVPPQSQMQPPQQSGYIPSQKQNQPSSSSQSGYIPPQQQSNNPQSGYIPPQQQSNNPQSGYIPPQQQSNNPQSGYIPPQQQPQTPQSGYIPSQPSHPPPSVAPQQQPQIQSLYQSPPSKPAQIPQKFIPSQEYLPPQNPAPAPPEHEAPKFQPVSPPPQIIDAYRNQAVYPVPPQAEKPLVLVMANSTSEPSPQKPSQSQSQYLPPDSFTQYENEQIGKTPSPGPSRTPSPSSQSQKPGSSPSTELALTEPLSQVLAEANAKAGDAMDKTIRFVIHKPEDEDVVKNAILEDAQTRYEDVRFVQGPNLKVQRKETVYLPPKKKTVVYILLKEPQIDTDVEVMTQDEEDPVPEVYITYQKSDGATKTKHYSPKPIKEEDMKKYIDIDDTSYGSGEESNVQPRFSKTTSVSLSTSSRTSRTSASMSASAQKPAEKKEDGPPSADENSLLLKNHRLSPSSYQNITNATLPTMKPSPLLYSQSSLRNLIGNSTKKARSSASLLPSPVYPPRRFSRNPVQCRTNV